MRKVRKVGPRKEQCEAVRLLRIFVSAAGHYQRQRLKVRKYNRSVGGCPDPPSLPTAYSTNASLSLTSNDD